MASRATSMKRAQRNFDKLPAKQRANMGPGTVAKVNNEAKQVSDRKDYESMPEGNVRRGK